MWKSVLTAGAFALGLSSVSAYAFNWNGFQSGMTPDEARDAAAGRGLELGREPRRAANATVPLYSLDTGDAEGFLTFCQGQLARVGTGLKDLDLGHAARLVDEYARHGDAQVRTMTMERGTRGIELSWAARSDEISLVMIQMGSQQLMQETRADIGLWDLCANMDGEPMEEPVEDEDPPTPEELILDALGRALRGEGGQ